MINFMELPLSEVEARVAGLPRGSLVKSLLRYTDGQGGPLYPFQAIDRIIAASSAPVFSHLEEPVARGKTGGYG